MKIGVLPDRVLMSLMNDRMIAKGTILDFITAFFKDYLATDSMDDLVQLLRKARLDDRLLDFFPPQRRNLTDFDAHVKASATKISAVDKLLLHSVRHHIRSRKSFSRLDLANFLAKAEGPALLLHSNLSCICSM